ncbi:hypothetical protein PROFUN_02076 [Planoprotostelium fungivorum]|uniref:60S acidic ribosomal protein P1 n=1 Tax=Planoprotostelium fungivorum TaxID=1890364 RepID=A0A2P6NBB3_9EUKA|nr:hypothetical protein PROFUN_02076 [Planoprotostelium fungivorum]
MSTEELACTYAALALHDDGIPVTADKIAALLNAAGVTFAPYWPGIFARALGNKNLDDLITNSGGGAPAAAPAASSAPAAGGAAPAAKEEKKKEEPKEEEDDDMGFGLFD